MRNPIVISLLLFQQVSFGQGSFAPEVGQNGTTAIYKDSSAFVAWASSCTLLLGPQDIAITNSPLVNVGSPFMATGKAGVNGVVSLGDGGSATVTFDTPIFDGSGNDFAIFENSFSDFFLELAFVEVSSDGITFFRFPSTSETQTNTQTGTFGLLDPTEINNLAGKYRGQYGTPFDLNELSGSPGLDLQSISHIKVIDVIGTVDSIYASYDNTGNIINDPYPTDFSSGGFDLDAIGVIHSTTTSIAEHKIDFSIYPNPTTGLFYLNLQQPAEVQIYTPLGQLVYSNSLHTGESRIDLLKNLPGVYFLSIHSNDTFAIEKISIE